MSQEQNQTKLRNPLSTFFILTHLHLCFLHKLFSGILNQAFSEKEKKSLLELLHIKRNIFFVLVLFLLLCLCLMKVRLSLTLHSKQ